MSTLLILAIQSMVKYYTWRHKAKDEIEQLFQKRKTDEYLLIEKDRKFADFIINALQE